MSPTTRPPDAGPIPSPLDEVKAMIVDLRAYLERTLNGTTVDGKFLPGVMPQLQDHERRLSVLEASRSWLKQTVYGLAVAVATALATVWATTHTGLSK